MHSVTEAQQIVLEHTPTGTASSVPLVEAVGRVLAVDINAPQDFPAFASSAMDGFAVRAADTASASTATPVRLQILETIAAGCPPTLPLRVGTASRIMTGAMPPPGADAIIPLEDIAAASETAITIATPVRAQQHLRPAGDDIRAAAVAIPRGTCLSAGSIGLLAALGITEVEIIAPPRVAILPTGNELVRAPAKCQRGQIYESNGAALQAALVSWRITPTLAAPIADNAAALRAALQPALAAHDMVCLTGGVSVGQYDLVKEVLAELGVETLFWQVAQKPGKPIFCGRRNRTLVFGLPGNPASSLVCYYLYVALAIARWCGREDTAHCTTARLDASIDTKPGRTQFLRGRAEPAESGWRVLPLSKQGSHCMQSFALANCLIEIPAEVQHLDAQTTVTIHWITP